MQKRSSIKLIILMLFIPFIFTGCYNRHEIDNLAYAVAIGIDVDEGDNIKITYQIAVPIKIVGEGAESGKGTYTTYSVSAPSLVEANKIVNSMTSKELSLSEVKAIIYSKELAEKSLKGRVNGLMSNEEIRPKAIIAVYDGKAEDFLKNITPKLEINPARYYDLLFSSFNYSSQTAVSELFEFYTSIKALDKECFAMFLKLSDADENKEAIPDGIAVFKGNKMIGVLNPTYVFAHLLLTNTLNYSGYSVKDFEDSSKVISVLIKQNSNPKITIDSSKDAPHIKCDLSVKAGLVSSGSNINFHDEKNKERLVKDLKEKIENDVNSYLSETIKNYKSDIAGLGRYAKKNFLTWSDFEKYNWLDKYQNSTYEVHANVELSTIQIVSNFLPDSEK